MEECSEGGLASFAREIAIDIGFVPEARSLPPETRSIQKDGDVVSGERHEGRVPPVSPAVQSTQMSLDSGEIDGPTVPLAPLASPK